MLMREQEESPCKHGNSKDTEANLSICVILDKGEWGVGSSLGGRFQKWKWAVYRQRETGQQVALAARTQWEGQLRGPPLLHSLAEVETLQVVVLTAPSGGRFSLGVS